MNSNIEDIELQEFKALINISDDDSKLYPDDGEEYDPNIHAFESMSEYCRNCAM